MTIYHSISSLAEILWLEVRLISLKRCHKVLIYSYFFHPKNILNYAKTKNIVINIGHIERYNPAFVNFIKNTRQPLFIEGHRLTTLQNRGLDISVILDLMIHDIDLILQLVKSPLREIISDGISVVSNNIDLATSRLVFENNCIVNLTASRISNKNMRKLEKLVFHRRMKYIDWPKINDSSFSMYSFTEAGVVRLSFDPTIKN